MFRAWQESPYDQQVSRKCAVSRATVKKYRIADQWDERAKKIQAKTQTRLNNSYASERAQLLRTIKRIRMAGIDEYVRKIQNNESIDLSIFELNTIIRLEQFLAGGVDSRPENQSQTNINLQLSDGERKKLSATYERVVAELERRGIDCN
jgi:hypothetical protein